jgi:hypothetical protein
VRDLELLESSADVSELRQLVTRAMPLGCAPPRPLPGRNTHQAGSTEVFYSIEQFLREVDPVFLTGRIRNGTGDCREIFRRLANTMKTYCAHERDKVVNEMVAAMELGNGLDALKTCFAILRYMKIVRPNTRLKTVLTLQDIVNTHLRRDYQPWLRDTAKHHELASFERALDYEGQLLEDSDTRNWINMASTKVLELSPRDRQAHMLGRCRCQSQAEFLIRSIVEGFISLVFAHWTLPDQCNWKHDLGVTLRHNETGWHAHVPESMRKDTNRLYGFSCVMTWYTSSR